MKVLLLFVVLLSSFNLDLKAQSKERDVLANAGGTAVIPGYVVNWTLGEAFVATRTNAVAELIVTEGFQQADSLGSVPVIELTDDLGLEITVSPNPAGNSVNISLSESPKKSLNVRLLDASGRTLREESLQSQSTSLNLTGLPAACYLLMLSDGENWVKTIKVLKQ